MNRHSPQSCVCNTPHVHWPWQARDERFIYDRDMAWLRECDAVVSEVTQPSLGVGYELGQAEAFGKPVLCLFRTTAGRSLSAMIRGNTTFTSKDYATLEDACGAVDEWFAGLPPRS